MNRRDHWEGVYASAPSHELSWYQADPSLSLELVQATEVGWDAGILDVGGGTSLLVDRLVARGYTRLGVLDIAGSALQVSQGRLGDAAHTVEWLEADVLSFQPSHQWDLWLDRAVFHFLVDPADRLRYRESLYRTVPEGGHVIVATFGPDGPRQCSGLNTLRLSPEEIGSELGTGVRLIEQRLEDHHTPSGEVQRFVYARLQRV